MRRVRVSASLSLSTLGANTVLPLTLTGAADGAYRIVSAKLNWTLVGLTEPEGPIVVGLNHSDYTVTEIKECIEASAGINVGNKIAQEQANRLVRIVGVMESDTDELNDGKPISTKLNWLMPIGMSTEMFAYNDAASALTTGAALKVNGDLWVRDN